MANHPPVWEPVPIPPQAPARQGVADLPDTRLFFWDTEGPGHPVILLHAATQSAMGWVYQQPALAAAGYRAIGYSRRGYQGSDGGEPGFASDDLLHLMRFMKVERADLVAAAQGGFFALDFALTHPDMVRSLTIVSSLMGITDPDYVAIGQRLRPAFFETLPHDFRELSPSYRAGNAEGLAAWQALEHAALTTGKRVVPKTRHKLTFALLETLRHPTLLMTGDSDLYTPPSMLRMQAAHMANAEMHIIAEAGHSPYFEQPVVFNRLLLDFLGRL